MTELERVITAALEGQGLDAADAAGIQAVVDCGPQGRSPENLPRLLEGARAVRQFHLGKRLSLCAIINAKSGACSEDCAFCAQSARHRTDSPRHEFLDPERIGQAAAQARANGASRFGIVASGLAPTEGEFERLEEAVRQVRSAGIAADVSVGLLTRERLERLTRAGLSGVHHNLETSRSYFPQICTTHDYEEDVQAVRLALDAGLFVCSGGIFGLGESWDDRVELALTLRELGVSSVPMNFLQPIPGTRLESRPVLSAAEALTILALYRLLLPAASLRVCGGRGMVFGAAGQRELFKSGASGIMIGDYLTVAGSSVVADLALAQELGLTPDPPEG